MYVQQQIQWPFLKDLKWHQQPSQDVRQCLNNLSYESFECICRRLSNHFFKTTACFDGESAAPPSAPKTPSYGKYNFEIVIERAFRTENMPWLWLFPVHEIRYKFFLPKMYFYQEPFQEFA